MTEYTERPSTAPAFSEARLLEQLKGAGAVYLRGDFKEPDIDFFAPAQVLENLRTLLSENAFYLLRGDSSKQIWGRFVAGRLLQVDLTLNFDYIFKNFPGVSFRPEFVEAFLRSPLSAQLSFNVLRYLFMERAGSKYRQYILSNR